MHALYQQSNSHFFLLSYYFYFSTSFKSLCLYLCLLLQKLHVCLHRSSTVDQSLHISHIYFTILHFSLHFLNEKKKIATTTSSHLLIFSATSHCCFCFSSVSRLWMLCLSQCKRLKMQQENFIRNKNTKNHRKKITDTEK